MIDVKAVITLQTIGKVILPGETIRLAEGDADALIRHGFATRVDAINSPQPVVNSKNHHHHDVVDIDVNHPEMSDALLRAIVDAIGSLESDNDFSKDGRPHANALSRVLGEHVSAEQRDIAWDYYQQLDNADA